MDDGAGGDPGFAEPDCLIGQLFDPDRKGSPREARELLEDRHEEPASAPRSINREGRTRPDKGGMDHGIEKKGDEVRKVVRVVVTEKEVLEAMAVHADFHEIH